MFQKFRPLHNNLLVQRLEEETKTSGGLYIPDSAKQETQIGKILAVTESRVSQIHSQAVNRIRVKLNSAE